MNRRYLIDDVCLLIARVFAVLSALVFLDSTLIIFGPASLQDVLTIGDGVPKGGFHASFIIITITLFVISLLWIASLWTLSSNTSRLFLKSTAAIYICFLLVSVARRGFANSLDAMFVFLAFTGMVSILWVSSRPALRMGSPQL